MSILCRIFGHQWAYGGRYVAVCVRRRCRGDVRAIKQVR